MNANKLDIMSYKRPGARGYKGFDTSNTVDDNANSTSLAGKINALEKDLERRQESYVARERAYKTRIEELEEELKFQRQEKTGWMKSDTKMGKLKSMQGQIMKNVELVQDRTSRVLQEQERDLLRAFRARLFDVQTELEKEKSKKEDGAGAWIERCRKLEAEVEWAKEVADRLERVNQTLMTDNSRLKSQFASQEEDRNFLISQLVGVKKENAQLKAEYQAIETDNDVLQVHVKKLEDEVGANLANRHSTNRAGDSSNTANDERYKEINARLRRLLSDERRALQHVRANYAQELRSRTEMEMLLRQCVDDVRKEIALKAVTMPMASRVNTTRGGTRVASAAPFPAMPGGGGAATGAAALPVSSFAQGDRERTLELLLSQERVISLIYAKTFPISSSSTGKQRVSSSTTALDSAGDGVTADPAILEAISMGTNGPGGGASSASMSDDILLDPDDLSVSQGGGGPLIAAALQEQAEGDGASANATKLPALR